MKRAGCLGLLAACALIVGGWLLAGTWFARGPLKPDTVFVVGDGATLAQVSGRLEEKGAVLSARTFRWRARLFGHGQTVKAGEFLLAAAIDRAQAMGADPLYLLTNRACEAAIHLYEKLGFRHDAAIMETYGARYARCDVAMRHHGPHL